MYFQNSKTFFKKLKETCKKIDSDVSEINKKLTEVPCNEELASLRMVDYRDKMKSLKTQANELKVMLEPKLEHTTDFIQNFKELLVETEDQVAKQENYLKQYGYKPINLEIKPPTEDADMPCVEQPDDIKRSSTPTLLDYGIVLHRNKFSLSDSSMQPSSVESKEHSDSTPTLEHSSVPVLEEETPPMPQCLPSIEIFPSTPTLEL